MEEKVNFTIVGIFVLVLSAGFIGGVLWFSSGKSHLKIYDVYQTYMSESVSGLNLNAPVRYHGVEVGRVQKIALAPGNTEQVQLTLDIERGTPVKVDTVAILQTQGLTGLAFLDLAGGSRDSPPLKKLANEKYPVIKTGRSLITRLDSAVTDLLKNLNQTSENFNALMDKDNQRKVKNTLTDIETLSHTLAARSATIDATLANASRTMESTARLANELPLLAQRVQRSADSFDRMTNELARAGSNANSTLNSTQQFTNETLPEVQQLVVELRSLTGSLQHFSDDLEKNPSILLYGKPAAQRGPGE
ncbi:chromosome partition protein Smc [mine drainage metagenome]|uniref:Chromosome partition protein Smc n=1 Tax=mine drainage metagenome TaxID=410659 RepID=A0A1J5SEC6_9ZZZZ